MLARSIRRMTEEVQSILNERFLSGYLYGSAALDDFQLGWSDIDVLYLSRRPLNAPNYFNPLSRLIAAGSFFIPSMFLKFFSYLPQ